jgi:hypothetical protein
VANYIRSGGGQCLLLRTCRTVRNIAALQGIPIWHRKK